MTPKILSNKRTSLCQLWITFVRFTKWNDMTCTCLRYLIILFLLFVLNQYFLIATVLCKSCIRHLFTRVCFRKVSLCVLWSGDIFICEFVLLARVDKLWLGYDLELFQFRFIISRNLFSITIKAKSKKNMF